MIIAPFLGPRLKLGHAENHVRELSRFVDDFSQGMVLRRSLISENDTHLTFCWTFDPPAPTLECALLMGDAIHNTRASLDLLICDIARIRGKSTSKLAFPFALNHQELRKTLGKSPFSGFGHDVCQAIERCKPYKENGNSELRKLHDYDIQDKHILMIPSISSVRGPDMQISPDFSAMFPRGNPIFDMLADVSFETRYYDGQNYIVSKEYFLNNSEPETIKGPIELRFPTEDHTGFTDPVIPRILNFIHIARDIIEEFSIQFGSSANA